MFLVLVVVPVFTVSSFQVDIFKCRSCHYGFPDNSSHKLLIFTHTDLVVTGACAFKKLMIILLNNGWSSLSIKSSLNVRSSLNTFSSNVS